MVTPNARRVAGQQNLASPPLALIARDTAIDPTHVQPPLKAPFPLTNGQPESILRSPGLSWGFNAMKKYKVFLNGKNFWIKADGHPKKMGFYTTRFVEADTPESAENLAVELVRKDAGLRKAVKNEKVRPAIDICRRYRDFEDVQRR
jgi:hypothetical protein